MMDKSCHSADSSTTTSGSNGVDTNPTRDQCLRHLNKLSHKISKPIGVSLVKKPTFDSNHLGQTQTQNQNQQPGSVQPQPLVQTQSDLPPPQQHQPPVYNINKNEFRDVVQKLTGSPAHERVSAPPPPIHPHKPQGSRLQRFRPPPLMHVSNRPPPLLNYAAPIVNPCSQANPPIPALAAPTGNFVQRPSPPLSPLPPFPAVHSAAESPVSAYMRYLQNSISTVDSNQRQSPGFMPLAPLVSSRWNNSAASQQPLLLPPALRPQPQQGTSSGSIQPQLPFGCLSPRSPYPLLSPGLLFSPNPSQLGFPLSPTVPVPSPTWEGL